MIALSQTQNSDLSTKTATKIFKVLLNVFAFDYFLILFVFPEGELVITSEMISQGYLKFDNSAFSKALDGRTTFRTGDIYAKPDKDHIIWKGRKDDYIQVGPFKTSLFLFILQFKT